MPVISRFWGIVIRMFYDDHNPPHIHVEHQGNKALFDFKGNMIKGDLKSGTAQKLVRKWIALRKTELEEDWKLAMEGNAVKAIDPLD